jgi:hypothetical protein
VLRAPKVSAKEIILGIVSDQDRLVEVSRRSSLRLRSTLKGARLLLVAM